MKNQQETNQNSKKTRADIEATLVVRAWQNEDFKKELLSNPREILIREFKQEIPKTTSIQVLEESNDTYYLVIPKKPELEEVLSEDQLEAIAGGFIDVDDWDVGDWSDHAGMPDSVTVTTKAGSITLEDNGPR